MLKYFYKTKGERRNKQSKCMKKDITEIFFATLILFVFAIMSLISYNILANFNNVVQDNDLLGDVGSDIVSQHTTKFPATFDNAFAFIFVGLGLILVISAFMVRNHPIFFVFIMIVFALFIIVNAVLANVYEDFASQSDLAELRDEFPIQEYIMGLFPFFIFFLSLVVAIIQYSKDYSRGGY